MAGHPTKRLKPVRTPPTSPSIKKIFKDHREAIVITADPDGGEANVAVFTKLSNEDGVLAACLEQILANLLRVKNAKQPHRKTKTTPTGS